MKILKTYLTLLICTGTIYTIAAQGTSPSFIGITGGISIPMGNWATTNYNDPKSGWAANGTIFGLEGAYFFSKYVGIGGLFNYATYSTKNPTALSAGYQQSFDVDTTWTTAHNYHVINLMPGLYFNFPFNKLAVIARACVGATYASTPEIDVRVEDGGVPDGTFTQKTSTAVALGFNAGAGISYRFVRYLSVNIKADYFYSDPNFSITNTNRNNNAGRLITSYHQPLTGVNFSLGLAYNFGKK